MKKSLILSVLLIRIVPFEAQDQVYHQFWNEFQFTHPVADKFALELDLSNTFSDSPENRSPLSSHTQFASALMVNYYYSAKWRFSLLGAYFGNYYVPEIGQRQYPEMRWTAQAVYFIRKIDYILQTRTKLEFRWIQNTTGDFENVFRYRQQFKYTQPLNSKFIREGTYFAIVSDEVFFKVPTGITGTQIFDRNNATLGLGYAINDDVQIDVDYTFEYLPREAGNEFYYAFQVNITVNNPFLDMRNKLKKR